jgi:hypothetical protein
VETEHEAKFGSGTGDVSLWFVVPVHGRIPLAAICLRQLERTCDELAGVGLEAHAVVIADRSNLIDLRRACGKLIGIPSTARPGRFAAIERDNRFLSMRFNDGIELATNPRYNAHPADYVVPFGSDDWADARIFTQLPGPREIIGFQRMSFVREDGREISESFVKYRGGCGIRIYPRQLLRRCNYRPADEDRSRGCDTSILLNVERETRGVVVTHADLHSRQIVDWKSPGANLNDYAQVGVWRREIADDPFRELAGVYPPESLEAMRELYGR